MLTIDQILENNSIENDICIATYGKEQFDELMQLLESKGYEWAGGQKPTACYGDITNELGKFFDMNNPYQFAEASILLIHLHYTDKKILYTPLAPDVPNAQSRYRLSFINEEGTRLIKPYLLLKKELEQACDFEG